MCCPLLEQFLLIVLLTLDYDDYQNHFCQQLENDDHACQTTIDFGWLNMTPNTWLWFFSTWFFFWLLRYFIVIILAIIFLPEFVIGIHRFWCCLLLYRNGSLEQVEQFDTVFFFCWWGFSLGSSLSLVCSCTAVRTMPYSSSLALSEHLIHQLSFPLQHQGNSDYNSIFLIFFFCTSNKYWKKTPTLSNIIKSNKCKRWYYQHQPPYTYTPQDDLKVANLMVFVCWCAAALPPSQSICSCRASVTAAVNQTASVPTFKILQDFPFVK